MTGEKVWGRPRPRGKEDTGVTKLELHPGRGGLSPITPAEKGSPVECLALSFAERSCHETSYTEKTLSTYNLCGKVFDRTGWSMEKKEDCSAILGRKFHPTEKERSPFVWRRKKKKNV